MNRNSQLFFRAFILILTGVFVLCFFNNDARAAKQIPPTTVTASYLSSDGQSHTSSGESVVVSVDDTTVSSSDQSRNNTLSDVSDSGDPSILNTISIDSDTDSNTSATTFSEDTQTPQSTIATISSSVSKFFASTTSKSTRSNRVSYIIWSMVLLIIIISVILKVRRRQQTNNSEDLSGSSLQQVNRWSFANLFSKRATIISVLLIVFCGLAVSLIYRHNFRADTNTAIGPGKYLITYPWNGPSYDAIMADPVGAGKIPVDGTVIFDKFFRHPLPDYSLIGNPGVFSTVAWPQNATPSDMSYFQSWIDKWQNVKDIKSLKHSLLGFNITPQTTGPLMSDDDGWSKSTQNLQTITTVAQTAGFEGLAIDTEVWGTNIFGYPKTYNGIDLNTYYNYDSAADVCGGTGGNASESDWQAFKTATQPIRDQAVQRGRQIATALNTAANGKDFDILFTLTPSNIVAYGISNLDGDVAKTWCSGYPLMFQIFAGLTADIAPNVHLYDGFERSYPSGSEAGIVKWNTILQNTAAILAGAGFPDYQKNMHISFGLWPDFWGSSPWYFTKNGVRYSSADCADNPTCIFYAPASDDASLHNPMPPSTLQNYITNMLNASDKYVWMYSQWPSAWGKFSINPLTPKRYVPFGNENYQAFSFGKQAKTTNNAPVWKNILPQTVLVGQQFSFSVPVESATDPDNDPLDTWVQSGPDGIIYSDQYHEQFTWTPTADQVGTQTITLKADDGLATAMTTISINVQIPDSTIALQITSDKTTIKTGESFTYSIHYTNTGNEAAKQVKVTIEVPSGLNVTAGQTEIMVGDLEAGKSGDITLTVTPT